MSEQNGMDIGPLRSEWTMENGDWFMLQMGARTAASGEEEPVIMATFLRTEGNMSVHMVFTVAEAAFLEAALRRMSR